MTEDSELGPDLIARWLSIAHLLSIASELRGRRAGAWPGLAVVSAQSASEALLSLIAGTIEPVPIGMKFDDILKRARKALTGKDHKIGDALATSLEMSNNLRNLILHRGVAVTSVEADAAIRAARSLRDVALNALSMLGEFRDAGPATVVARSIDNATVSQSLAKAESLLAAGDAVTAAKMAAIALDALLSSTTPSLRGRDGAVRWRTGSFGRGGASRPAEHSQADAALDRAFGDLSKRDARIEAWVLALGVGLPPAELARLGALVGEPVYSMAQDRLDPKAVYGGAKSPSREEVEWAVLTIADIAFRLAVVRALPGAHFGEAARASDRPEEDLPEDE